MTLAIEVTEDRVPQARFPESMGKPSVFVLAVREEVECFGVFPSEEEFELAKLSRLKAARVGEKLTKRQKLDGVIVSSTSICLITRRRSC